MSNPGTPPPATLPVPPPIQNLPIVDERGFPTPVFAEQWQLMWAALQGSGGIIDIITQTIEMPSAGTAQSLIDQTSDKAGPLVNLLGRLGALEQRIAGLAIRSATPPPWALALPLSPSPILWTPSIAGSTTPGTQTYAAQAGYFFDVGPAIFAFYYIMLSALDGTTAGNVIITGLPIACGPTLVTGAVPLWGGITLGAGYTAVGAFMNQSSTNIFFSESGSTLAQAALPVATLSAATLLAGTMLYFR